MVTRGYEASKAYLEEKFKYGKITREELQKRLRQLSANYKNGTARRELETAGIKNYRDY